MKIFLTLSICVCITSAVIGQQPEVRQIDSLMQTAWSRGIFNGNILVVKNGQPIYQKSLGIADASKQTSLTKDMKFDIGSISKEFNGVAIMLLCEKGKLSLDNPLSKYFAEFPDWAKEVKIRHLINYTSGIPVLGSPYDNTDSAIEQSLIHLQTLTAKPGTVYIYNNVNVSLQRRIIEKVSGMSYADFITKKLLRPAGMNASLVDYPVDGAGMARAFDNRGNVVPYTQDTYGWVRLPIDDLYKWTQALHSYKIIKPASLKILAQGFPGGESSLGTTGFDGDSMIWHQHQGSNSNYEAAFYYNLPEQIGIFMTTNNQQMKVWPLKTAILEILHHQPYMVPKKSLYLSIRDKMLSNVDSGILYYRELKAAHQDLYDFSFEMGDLISTGKFLQRRKKYADAIRVFSTAIALPGKPEDVSYGYELIGDCYRSEEDSANAVVSYQRALAIFPQNKNAAALVEKLKGKP